MCAATVRNTTTTYYFTTACIHKNIKNETNKMTNNVPFEKLLLSFLVIYGLLAHHNHHLRHLVGQTLVFHHRAFDL